MKEHAKLFKENKVVGADLLEGYWAVTCKFQRASRGGDDFGDALGTRAGVADVNAFRAELRELSAFKK